jgi:hypothetical protein
MGRSVWYHPVTVQEDIKVLTAINRLCRLYVSWIVTLPVYTLKMEVTEAFVAPWMPTRRQNADDHSQKRCPCSDLCSTCDNLKSSVEMVCMSIDYIQRHIWVRQKMIMNDDWVRMWKDKHVAIFNKCPGVRLHGLRLNRTSWSSGQFSCFIVRSVRLRLFVVFLSPSRQMLR